MERSGLAAAGAAGATGVVAVALGLSALLGAAPWPVGAVGGFLLVGSVVGLGAIRTLDAQRRSLAGTVAARDDELAATRQALDTAEERLRSRLELTSTRTSTLADELTDPSSGLYSEGYFTVALAAHVAAARRALEPLAIVALEVVEGLGGAAAGPADARLVATALRDTVREADTACRLLDGGFALILDDADENGAVWTIERFRRQLADVQPGLTVWAGVACYPAHGLNPPDLTDAADLALDLAREWRQDRIEVAKADSTTS